MALGLEEAIAEYVSTTLPQVRAGTYGLYTEAALSDRIIYVGSIQPIPPNAAEVGWPDLTITIYTDTGPAPVGLLREDWVLSVHVRHPSYETTLEVARAIFALLHENGGGGNGANAFANGRYKGIRVRRITADSQPTRLGRDLDGADGRYATLQTFTVSALGGFDFT